MPNGTLLRGRNFIVTLTNPTQEAEQLQSLFEENNVRYAFQAEREKSGTRHYQIYLNCEQPRTCNYIRALLSKAHVEIARNAEAAKQYCTKSDTRIEGPWD
ncbi:hypothetical protein AHF37_09909 [Paragonimus kellicotti]|nr:hypothetical protein AHF37_09909 [Paragonimus kellicotti]